MGEWKSDAESAGLANGEAGASAASGGPFRKRVVVAHRGWSGRAPENTLAAFRLALDDPRIDWVELDVQLSKDGVPVVIHDFTLKRTTGRTGRVKDYTWRELAEMDAGSWFSPAFAGERIPSLEQVLELFGGRMRLNIELKTAIGLYPGLEKAVTAMVRQFGLADRVVLTSFDHYAVMRARSAAPEIRGGLIISGLPTMVREQMRFAGADFLSMEHLFVSGAFVRDMIDSGTQVMVWTVNERKEIRRTLAMHPGLMICTNHPDRVFGMLET
jgi:glycerophosphoryl diester phosphodiesterase